jgi:hypothetical protein
MGRLASIQQKGEEALPPAKYREAVSHRLSLFGNKNKTFDSYSALSSNPVRLKLGNPPFPAVYNLLLRYFSSQQRLFWQLLFYFQTHPLKKQTLIG